MKGIGEAPGAVFPATTLQTFIVHLMRNSLDDARLNDRKLLAAALDEFECGAWARSTSRTACWRCARDRVIPFFAFPPAVRRVVFTTNAIASIHSQMRKIVKKRGSRRGVSDLHVDGRHVPAPGERRDRPLIVRSGVHGVEGLTGTAVQRRVGHAFVTAEMLIGPQADRACCSARSTRTASRLAPHHRQ